MSLREARIAAGLSQAGLASAAGISRQGVGAIEAGRHRPSIDTALALARVVDRPVEELFAPRPAESEPAIGVEASEGEGVLACRVGSRVSFAPASRALGLQGWPQPNAAIRDGRPEPLPGADLDGLLVVGCDPALGLASAMLPGAGPRRVLALAGSTRSAIDAVEGGRSHGALVHDAPGGLPEPPPGTLRIRLARWRVGLAAAQPSAPSVEEVCEREVAVVQREDGASSQKAFLAAAAKAGLGPPVGPRATDHLEVAARVAHGAPAGVTMEPAAKRFGLAFCPLEEHAAELWIDAAWREHPAVDALVELLASAGFAERLRLVGGYEVTGCGSTVGAS